LNRFIELLESDLPLFQLAWKLPPVLTDWRYDALHDALFDVLSPLEP